VAALLGGEAVKPAPFPSNGIVQPKPPGKRRGLPPGQGKLTAEQKKIIRDRWHLLTDEQQRMMGDSLKRKWAEEFSVGLLSVVSTISNNVEKAVAAARARHLAVQLTH
jgi:hypothetical protein